MCQRWYRTPTRLATTSIQRKQGMRQRADRRACARESRSYHQCLLPGLGLHRHGEDGWFSAPKVTRSVHRPAPPIASGSLNLAAADGAKIPIRLGFGNIGDVTGRYWGNPSIADSGDGQVMEW